MALDVTAVLHSALLCAAFWTAVSLYRGRRPLRFVAGLGLGAVLTHLGWALLHWPALGRHPAALLDPALGYCVLFFPLGPLLLAPEAASWRALPLALVVARLGCLAAGCCHGAAAAWGSHPTPLYEMALLLGLHFALRAVSDARAAAVFLAGFGLERLVVEPFRAAPPLGAPALAPALLAVLWVAAGLLALLPLRPLLPALACLLAALGCGGVQLTAPPDERPDYLRYVAFRVVGSEDVLLRWPRHKMPLAVFLPVPPEGLFPNPREVWAAAHAGVVVWTDVAADGVPAFRFVQTAGDADIPIAWAEVSPSRSIAHCFYDINQFQRRFGVAQILVTGRYRDGSFATAEDIRATVTHEMGHALGLGGHSPNSEDIMYGFRELGLPRQGQMPAVLGPDFEHGSGPELTRRDRATLRRLYAKPIGARMAGAKHAY